MKPQAWTDDDVHCHCAIDSLAVPFLIFIALKIESKHQYQDWIKYLVQVFDHEAMAISLYLFFLKKNWKK